ncbi:MAG: hypothetical protein U0163_20920, partial [Gemmatimonadaceae bacterium]
LERTWTNSPISGARSGKYRLAGGAVKEATGGGEKRRLERILLHGRCAVKNLAAASFRLWGEAVQTTKKPAEHSLSVGCGFDRLAVECNEPSSG